MVVFIAALKSAIVFESSARVCGEGGIDIDGGKGVEMSGWIYYTMNNHS